MADGAIEDVLRRVDEEDGSLDSLNEDELERLLDYFDNVLEEKNAALEGAEEGEDGGVDSVGDDDGSLSDERMKEGGNGSMTKEKKGTRHGKKATVSDMNAKRAKRDSRSEGPLDETQRNIASVLEGLRF